MTTTHHRATLADLHRFDGRAELIDGRLVELPMSGFGPSRIASWVFLALQAHLDAGRVRGYAFPEGLDYAVPRLRSGRESFRPDASFYAGPPPEDMMEFVPGPPTFAVEVRSKDDYGPAAERDMAAKRADYFEAGTLVVWDVDPEEELVRVYRNGEARTPAAVFRCGDTADAEPAVPGWRMSVDTVFGRPRPQI